MRGGPSSIVVGHDPALSAERSEERAEAALWHRLRGHWNSLVGPRAEDELLAVSARRAANPGLLIFAFITAFSVMAIVAGLRDGGAAFGVLLIVAGAAAGAEVIGQMVERHRPGYFPMLIVKVAFYAMAVGMALWVLLASPEPLTYARHPIVFLIYVLLIITAGLRDEPRLPLGAGVASLVSYWLVATFVPRIAATSEPEKAVALLRDFDGTSVIGHSVILLCTTMMAVASARRGQAVRRLSVRDGLTGLVNRQVFDACLATEGERARRSEQPLSVAMIDVDYFKSLNDTYGHAFGDEVLRWIAQLLQESFRSTDLVARYGGEEFCVVFLDSADDRLVERLDALRARIAATELRTSDSPRTVRVTVSVGVAAWPADAEDVHAALSVADARLYLAKGQGRNRVVSGGES